MRYFVLWALPAWFCLTAPGLAADDYILQAQAASTLAPDTPVPQLLEGGVCPECLGYGPCTRCGHVWSVDAGAVVLHRSNPGYQTLLMDTGTPAGAQLLNAHDFDFGTEAGPTVTISRHFEPVSLQLRYFGVDDWSRSVGSITSNGLYVPFATPLADTDLSYNGSARYESDLHSLEFNFTRPLCDSWGFILGYRYLELKEDLGMHLIGTSGPVTSQTDIGLSAKNRLHGFQLGVGGDVWNRGGRFRMEGSVKAGVYSDLMHANTSINQDGSISAAAAQTHHAAFLGELELAGVYQVTQRLAVRAGYQVLWIEGVALASDQMTTLNPSSGGRIDTSGSPMYHGVNASVQYTW